jgi:hypothetical protein
MHVPPTIIQSNRRVNWSYFLHIIYLAKCLNRKTNSTWSVKYLPDMPPWLVRTQTSTVTFISPLITSAGNWLAFKFPYKFSLHSLTNRVPVFQTLCSVTSLLKAKWRRIWLDQCFPIISSVENLSRLKYIFHGTPALFLSWQYDIFVNCIWVDTRWQ